MISLDLTKALEVRKAGDQSLSLHKMNSIFFFFLKKLEPPTSIKKVISTDMSERAALDCTLSKILLIGNFCVFVGENWWQIS